MKRRQRWMVRRRPGVGHTAAQRRWDRAYQLLLRATAAPAAGEPTLSALPAAPRDDATEESRCASSRLRSGFEPAPSPGADH